MTPNPENFYLLCKGIPNNQRIVVNFQKAIHGTFIEALTCDKEICKSCNVQRKHVIFDELCPELSLALFIYLYMKQHETYPNSQDLRDYAIKMQKSPEKFQKVADVLFGQEPLFY